MGIGKHFFTIGQQLLLRRAFHRLDVKTVPFDTPSMIIVNHSSFYDSLVLFELQRKGKIPWEIAALMNAQNREKIPLFKALGTIPVSTPMKLSEYKQVKKTMQTESLLLFPQGKEEHLEQRPLTMQEGAAKLLTQNQTQGLLIIVIYYSFRSAIRAEIACSMRFISAAERPKFITNEYIEQQLLMELESLKEDVIHQSLKGYERLW